MTQGLRQQVRLRFLALALLVAACSDDNVPTSTPHNPAGKDQIQPPPENPITRPSGDGFLSTRLVPIDPRELALQSTPDELGAGRYRYRITRAPARMPVAGDIIAGWAHDQTYLRRVTAVARETDAISFETFAAQLYEVVKGGTYHASGALPSPAERATRATGAGPNPSADLPSASVSLTGINLCTLIADKAGFQICGQEKTKIDKGWVELNGRLDSLALAEGSIAVSGTWDADYTIDPGGQLVLNTGRRPVFSPCDSYPNVTGCFSKIGTLLTSFLTSVGINPGVLPPPRVCIPGTPITIVPGSLFPFRLPTIRICKITDYGALPEFTPPFLKAATVTLRPVINSKAVIDIAGTGQLKLDIPIPDLAVVKCADHGNGFFCVKLGLFFIVQLRAVELGGQVTLNHAAEHEVVLTWTPETEWTQSISNKSRDMSASFNPNNPPDTVAVRLGPAVELELSLCFGTSASSCEDESDPDADGGGLIDLRLGVSGKATLGGYLDSNWSRDDSFHNWHIHSEGVDELELEGKLLLPRLLFRVDKNLKRTWTYPFLRHDLLDIHGTGILDVAAVTTGASPDPDGYTVTVARADTLPGLVAAGVQRIVPPFRPNWVDTLHSTIGINNSIEFTPGHPCLALYSDVIQIGQPVGRWLGLPIPNYVQEIGCDLVIADYKVTLGGVQDNCVVQGGNTHNVRLKQAQSYPTPVERVVSDTFKVVCPAPAVTPGALTVTTETTGFVLDPDGYTVTLDGLEQGPIATNGTVTLGALSPGKGRVVSLTGVASNCTFGGGYTLPVDITSAATTAVTLPVFCGPIAVPEAAPVSLRIRTTTSGPAPDPDGFTLTVNGAGAGHLGTSDEMLVEDGPVKPGTNVAALGDVAPNCTASGGGTASTKVTPGTTGLIEFTISCVAIQDAGPTGSVRVAVTTTGEDLDPDGYRLKVGSGDTPVGSNETVTVSGLAPGLASLSLDGVAANCSVQGALPITVAVSVNATTDAAFTVTCEGNAGIDLTTHTTGTELDLDGYRIIVDGLDKGPIGANATVHVGGLIAGPHTILLDGIASNCSVGGTYPAQPELAAGATGAIGFDVSCIAAKDLGAVQVKLAGQGKKNPGAFQVILDGVLRGTTDANGELSISPVFPGDHLVELAGLGESCKWVGQYPRQIKVNKGGAARETFNYVCK